MIGDFDVACDFYKTHVNKAFKLTYDQKLALSSLFNQAKHGPFSFDKASDVGFFDFVGKERRAKWQALGTMSKIEAQGAFFQLLLQICPQFASYLEAINTTPCQSVLSDSVNAPANLSLHLSPSQESRIRDALNSQTLNQFRAYSAQCYPDDETKQALLITQLQDRHFHQYMIYIANNPSVQSAAFPQNSNPSPLVSQTMSNDDSTSAENQFHESTNTKPTSKRAKPPSVSEHRTEEGDLVAHIPNGRGHVMSPQMWIRNDITEFKALLAKDPTSVINVGSGELVTIRVPVISSGNCFVWEFATDSYDIGFGLSFEWPSEPVDSTDKLSDGSELEIRDEKSSTPPWNSIRSSCHSHENGGHLTSRCTADPTPIPLPVERTF